MYKNFPKSTLLIEGDINTIELFISDCKKRNISKNFITEIINNGYIFDITQRESGSSIFYCLNDATDIHFYELENLFDNYGLKFDLVIETAKLYKIKEDFKIYELTSKMSGNISAILDRKRFYKDFDILVDGIKQNICFEYDSLTTADAQVIMKCIYKSFDDSYIRHDEIIDKVTDILNGYNMKYIL